MANQSNSAKTGYRCAYRRVSTAEQTTARQLVDGVFDRIFEDVSSGKDRNRPALQEMLAYMRSGDTLVVQSLDRLGRDLRDLLDIVQGLTDRGVRVEFVTEGLVFTGEESPISKLMLSLLGAIAAFERALIRERQRSGIEAAKKRGVYRSGRRKKLSAGQVDEARRRVAAGESKASLAREFGVDRTTLWSALRRQAS